MGAIDARVTTSTEEAQATAPAVALGSSSSSYPSPPPSPVNATTVYVVPGAEGRMLDLEVTVHVYGEGTQCGVRVLMDLNGGDEYVEVLTEPATYSTTSRNRNRRGTTTEPSSASSISSSSYTERSMRVLVDSSIVEAFFDKGTRPSQTFFSFPTSDASIGVAAVATSTTAATSTTTTSTTTTSSSSSSTSNSTSDTDEEEDEEEKRCDFVQFDVYPMSPFQFALRL
jgi:hypothetical protein